MTKLTLQQFDGLTVEERDAYLERRDREERQRAILAEGKSAFLRFAAEFVRRERSLIFDIPNLAAKVAEKCREAGVINPRGGAPYSEKTAYNYLAENRIQLLDALAGEIPASAETFLPMGSNDDNGTAENSY